MSRNSHEYESQCRWLSEFYAACARGERPEYYHASKMLPLKWTDATNHQGPNMKSDKNQWRTVKAPRECEGVVVDKEFYGQAVVEVPEDWPAGTPVRVVQILPEYAA